MNLVILGVLVALSSAAQLPSKGYLPSHQGIASGFAGSYSSTGATGAGDNSNTRAQQAFEKNAEILKLDQEVGEKGFRYNYETSNGIQAEETGNTGQTQGGFAYKGDDGTTYTVTFTAGVGGFQPQGAHLPVPPPIPQEILLALQQNAKDEASGIFDDGLYHPDAEEGARGRPSTGGRTGSSQGFGSTNRQGSSSANSGYNY